MNRHGISFNDWTSAYHRHGRENGGTEWLENQLETLKIAIDNAKQLDEHYADKKPYLNTWNYRGN